MNWTHALWAVAILVVGIFIGASKPALGSTLSLGVLKTG
jgi:hypothetical protein